MKKKRSNLMWVATALLLVAQMTRAAEGQGGPGEGMGLLTILFLAFGALIILFQAVPAIIMFFSMVASLLKKPVLEGTEEVELGKPHVDIRR